jgi:pescadillo protein
MEGMLIARYPTFSLALQDMQDPLNLVHLFSKLPTNPVPGRTVVESETIAECGRLINEWKLWAIKTHSLRKMFLGIKGIYYECDAPGHKGEMVRVRWLESYDFQQHVPTDVDFRILLTFIELYRTLLSFALYRLYTEENLVYPPPLDEELEKKGETVGAFKLVEKSNNEGAQGNVSKKEVKRAIRGIRAGGATVEDEEDVEMDGEDVAAGEEKDEDFVERPTKADGTEDVTSAPLTTYNSLVASSSTSKPTLLFAPYTFYVSRETSPKTWEFVIRAMGGKAITSLSATSPELSKDADSITHILVDRPMTPERMREMQGSRKWVWVQPQWVADCINKGKVIGTESYGPGELLPPHLSPWDGEGDVDRPWLEEKVGDAIVDAEEDDEDVDLEEEDEDEEEEEEDESMSGPATYPPALLAAAADPTNSTLVRAAELEAETSGTPHSVFETQLKEATKIAKATSGSKAKAPAKGAKGEEDLRKIMMTNKKARLYEKMKYSNTQKSDEVSLLLYALVGSAMLIVHRKRNSSASERISRRGRRGRARLSQTRYPFSLASSPLHVFILDRAFISACIVYVLSTGPTMNLVLSPTTLYSMPLLPEWHPAKYIAWNLSTACPQNPTSDIP